MQLVAKNLLTDYAAQFKGKSKAALAQWMVARKFETLAARSPFSALHKGDLSDADTQLSLFRYREARLLFGAGSRLRSMTASGKMTAYNAFTSMQNELLALAFAHVERVVLEQFNAGIRDCPDASLRPVLGKLRDLFALYHLEKGRAWFLEQRVLSPRRSEWLTSEVDKLCAQIRHEAVALVDAFGIPAACLAAPIALD